MSEDAFLLDYYHKDLMNHCFQSSSHMERSLSNEMIYSKRESIGECDYAYIWRLSFLKNIKKKLISIDFWNIADLVQL